jgi:hypothetical protein
VHARPRSALVLGLLCSHLRRCSTAELRPQHVGHSSPRRWKDMFRKQPLNLTGEQAHPKQNLNQDKARGHSKEVRARKMTVSPETPGHPGSVDTSGPGSSTNKILQERHRCHPETRPGRQCTQERKGHQGHPKTGSTQGHWLSWGDSNDIFPSFFTGLEMGPRASHMLGKSVPLEPQTSPGFCF